MRKYSLLTFIFDVLLTLLTSGLWLIWIFCREMRRTRAPRRTSYQAPYYPDPYRRY